MKGTSDRLAFRLFLLAIALVIFGYGIAVGRYKIFPYSIFSAAADGFNELRTTPVVGDKLPEGQRRAPYPDRPRLTNPGGACEGVNLAVECSADRTVIAKIMTPDGKVLHQWDLDIFRLWPNPDHAPRPFRPKSRPGTFVHGIVIMENGDLVFNYELIGLIRINREGEVVWRLPYQTHHSVHLHDDGNLWVCGQKYHTKSTDRFPNRKPPFKEFMLLEVSPEGKILHEWSVAELLKKNNLTGLLYLCSTKSQFTKVKADVLHLNDVEPFPNTMKEGFFKKGDVLVSLRNINTVFCFNKNTEKIKLVCAGEFVRQHDPDFIDGNTFSVLDNHNVIPENQGPQSRIVIVSAPDKEVKTYFEGNPKIPFYTRVAGKHQWLPNGNLLISEATKGRAFEITPEGELVWEYNNYINDKTIGWFSEVQRLPLKYERLFTAPNQEKPEAEPVETVAKNKEPEKR